MKIPRRIFTMWLNDNPVLPEVIDHCIKSQIATGYEHKIITLDNYFKGCRYVNEAIEAKKWVKASDWLRIYYLYTEGGIFLDGDMEVLPGKNFDHLLDNEMFIPREKCGHYGNSGCGSIPGTRLFKEYLDTVSNNFVGSGDLVYEPGIRCFSDICWRANRDGWYNNVKELTPDYIFPYNAIERTTEVTPNTIVFHHFMNSWAPTTTLPVVSFIIPTLGREDGLKRCVESIQRSNYPDHLKEIIVLDGPGTVPMKVKDGLAQSHGSLIVYASNDIEFTPDSINNAVTASKKKGLVAFNSGDVYSDKGNICEHFLIRRDMINKIGGEIFCTRFHHVGCDNLLYEKCNRLNEFIWCHDAVIKHYHFSKGAPMDYVYELGWSKVDEDRAILAEELAKL